MHATGKKGRYWNNYELMESELLLMLDLLKCLYNENPLSFFNWSIVDL